MDYSDQQIVAISCDLLHNASASTRYDSASRRRCPQLMLPGVYTSLCLLFVGLDRTVLLSDFSMGNSPFCKSWIARVSLRRERGLIEFFPFLKFRIAHSATQDVRERSLVENCLACTRMSSRYFASTTLSYSRNVSSNGFRASASAIIERSGPLAQRVDDSLPT